MSPPPVPPPLPSRPGRRLRLVGWTVSVLGLIAAAAVFFLAAAGEADVESVRIVDGRADATGDSSRSDRQSERLGGRALVRTAEFDHWLRSLLQGRRLAGTLAVLSVLVGAGCGHLAGLADEADEPDE